MELIDADDINQATFPIRLTSGEREVLDHFCLCHEKGPGPHQGNVRLRRIILFLSGCLAICVGSVIFANQIPPSLTAVVVGFIIGALFVLARQHVAFLRYWRLIDSIIDWKLVERMRKNSDPLIDRDF